MYHRMYLRRCSMSSISEESEMGDDDHLWMKNLLYVMMKRIIMSNEQQNQPRKSVSVENCLGDLNSFKAVSNVFFLLLSLYIYIYVTFPGDQPSN